MLWLLLLQILDDCDEESQQRGDALASLDDVDRNWAAFRHMGNYGCLPVVTSWVVYLVCRSFSHSEKLCMGPGSPKLTHVSKQ